MMKKEFKREESFFRASDKRTVGDEGSEYRSVTGEAAFNIRCDGLILGPLAGKLNESEHRGESMPSIWGTFGGVKTDDSCRALTAKQEVIEGLYVAGVDNGSIYASPYYENEGAALGTAFTSGVVAGKCMVEYIKG